MTKFKHFYLKRHGKQVALHLKRNKALVLYVSQTGTLLTTPESTQILSDEEWLELFTIPPKGNLDMLAEMNVLQG